MPEPPSDAGLRRRIDAARDRGPARRKAMQTQELPLPEVPPLQAEPGPEDMADAGIEPAHASRPPPATQRRREHRPEPVVDDLFAPREPEPAAAVIDVVRVAPEQDAVAAPAEDPDPVPPANAAAEPDPVPSPAVSVATPADVPPPVDPEPGRSPEPAAPYHLDPQSVMLQQVDHRNLRPTDRTDSYLYHITNRSEAASALDSGLVVSAQDPVILTERQGVAYWLSILAEDFDVILDGPADFVVLRMRRIAVQELLEPDPDASRSAGCACYLLTGGIAV